MKGIINMKKLLLVSIVSLFSLSSFAEKTVGTSSVTKLQHDPSIAIVKVTGAAAATLFEMAASNPDDVDYYDGGVSVVYKNDLACLSKKTAKKTTYSCTIVLKDGKAAPSPRG